MAKLHLTHQNLRGWYNMAQKIELGLYLEGDDARRFEEYMADPDRYDTPEGREMTTVGYVLTERNW